MGCVLTIYGGESEEDVPNAAALLCFRHLLEENGLSLIGIPHQLTNMADCKSAASAFTILEHPNCGE